jgi:hypothetical protein
MINMNKIWTAILYRILREFFLNIKKEKVRVFNNITNNTRSLDFKKEHNSSNIQYSIFKDLKDEQYVPFHKESLRKIKN